jgi:hypothetical protein
MKRAENNKDFSNFTNDVVATETTKQKKKKKKKKKKKPHTHTQMPTHSVKQLITQEAK